MPYVISTRSPFPHTQRMGDVSRCAVVTLEEVARQHPALCIAESIERPGEGLVCLFDEAGGTVGPLPDGTVIEVQRYTEHSFRIHAAGHGIFPQDVGGLPEIIDAYSARQEAE